MWRRLESTEAWERKNRLESEAVHRISTATTVKECLAPLELYLKCDRSPDRHAVQEIVRITQADHTLTAATLIQALYAMMKAEAHVSDIVVQRMLSRFAMQGDYRSISLVLTFLEDHGIELNARHLKVGMQALRSRGENQNALNLYKSVSELGVSLYPSVIIEALRCGLRGSAIEILAEHTFTLADCFPADLEALVRYGLERSEYDLVLQILTKYHQVYRADARIFAEVLRFILAATDTSDSEELPENSSLGRALHIVKEVMPLHDRPLDAGHGDIFLRIVQSSGPLADIPGVREEIDKMVNNIWPLLDREAQQVWHKVKKQKTDKLKWELIGIFDEK